VPGLKTPPQYTITYTSIPQPGLNNRTSPVSTAKVVGGASVHNGMFFNRGSKDDYDAWEKLGNPGWAWDDLLPYFKKVSPQSSNLLSWVLTSARRLERKLHASARGFSSTVPHLE
jgi:choline dehydrogenase-like flavoprotein